ncbi:MAG: sigma 54-interacting transcriptional regulator [Polyangiales bacterium]
MPGPPRDPKDPHAEPTRSILRTPAGVEARVRPFHLRVLAGPDAGKTLTSKGDRATVGTHPSADLVLVDPTVSRFHCEIAIGDSGYVLSDLQSRNGTRAGGVAIERARLDASTTLTLGDTQILFEPSRESQTIGLSASDRFGTMVGRSPALRQAFAVLERAAACDATVLLLGETGSGKEAAAESIHREGSRANKPFMVVDCGALPPELLESELFGHERGAFTSAIRSRAGVFEEGNGGTVFLDEIGELPLDLQPKLLRVLEKKEIRRVGSNKHQVVDVRIVAATHRSLREEVNAKRFRSDLYYRLAVLEIRLPALRDRLEDLPLLIDHLLKALGASGRPEAALFRTETFLTALAQHRWPGNVRELRNYLERCLALAEQAPLDSIDGAPASSRAPSIDVAVPLKEARDRWVAAFESQYLKAILDAHAGNVTAAARAAEMDRIHFYRLLWRHGLKERG